MNQKYSLMKIYIKSPYVQYLYVNKLPTRTHFKVLIDFMIFSSNLITFSSEYTTNIFSKSIFFFNNK